MPVHLFSSLANFTSAATRQFAPSPLLPFCPLSLLLPPPFIHPHLASPKRNSLHPLSFLKPSPLRKLPPLKEITALLATISPFPPWFELPPQQRRKTLLFPPHTALQPFSPRAQSAYSPLLTSPTPEPPDPVRRDLFFPAQADIRILCLVRHLLFFFLFQRS